MNKKTVGGCISIIWLAVFSVQAYTFEAGMRQKLAMLPFTAKNIEAMAITENLMSFLINNIDRSGYFEIFERKKIENIIEVEGLRLDGLSREDMFRIGSKNDIDFILAGNVTRAGSIVAVEFQLMNVRGKKVCVSDTLRFSEAETLARLQETARDLINNAKTCVSDSAQKPLQPPIGLKASGTSNSIRLQWSYPDMQAVAGFTIFRSGSEGGPFIPIATNTEGAYTDENLSLNETFYYRIKPISRTGEGESGFSPVVVGKTSVAPHTPIFLSVQPDVKSTVLRWVARPQAVKEQGTEDVGYKIYRKTSQEKDFKAVGSVSAETFSFRDSGLSDKTQYSYAITVFNKNMTESEFSVSLDATTHGGVDGLNAEGNKIRHVPITWSAHISDSVEGYRIYRADEKNGEYRRVADVSGRRNTIYVDKDLEDNKTYWYRIPAYNKAGVETDLSEPISATTRDKPPVPAGLTAKSGEPRKVPLRWELRKSQEDEIRGYKIYRATERSGDYKHIGDTGAEENSFVDDRSALNDNTIYYYSVVSYNSADAESPKSEAVAAITKAVPQSPSGIEAVSGAVKKVSLSWDKNPEPDIKEYIVYRKSAGEKNFDEMKIVKGDPSYTDTGLKDGDEYLYAVQTIDNDGLASPMSAEVPAKTKPVPKKPSGLKLTEKDGKKILVWDTNPEKDIKHYNVYKKVFLGASKLVSTQTNAWMVEDIKVKNELFVTALDADDLESEGSDSIVFE